MSALRLTARATTGWDGTALVELTIAFACIASYVELTPAEALGLAGALELAAVDELEFPDGDDRDT